MDIISSIRRAKMAHVPGVGPVYARVYCCITLLVSIVFITAQAPVPALTSSYVQALIGYGGGAAGAVACGLRQPQWGGVLHSKLSQLLSTHAGAPVDVTPSGEVVNATHPASDAEKQAALSSLKRHEDEGIRRASDPYAKQGNSTSYCTVIENMQLQELDDYESDAVSLWPTP